MDGLHLQQMKKFISILFLLCVLQAGAQKTPIPAHRNNDITQKMGYVDPSSGKFIIPAMFDFCRPFGPDGTAVVFESGKAGFIDEKGNWIIKPQFDDAQNFNSDGIAIVRKAGRSDNQDGHDPSNDKYAAIDKTGKLILPFIFRDLNDKSFPGTMVGRQKYKWGMVSTKGKIILPFEYDMINVHGSREVAILRQDSLLGVINKDLVMVVPMGDNMARFAGNSRISLYKDGLFGYCNFNGDMVIDYKYGQFAIFREGLCVIRQNEHYGYIDTNGNTVIPFIYDGGEPFVNDTAIVLKQGKMGMINSKNEILVEFVYDKISRFYFPKPPGGFVLIKRDEWYFIDPNTHVITPWDEWDQNDPNLNRPTTEPKEEDD
ncbi:MAG: hypothetical protein GC180_02920 [Bacteroidetes bacterium]|nr:hypothetical protein [Bacteroidota bacterium]